MIGTNVSRGEARTGAWIARALSGVLLLGALGTVVFGGSQQIPPAEIPEPASRQTEVNTNPLPPAEQWDPGTIAFNLGAWDGPEPKPDSDGDGRSQEQPLTPTEQPMKYLGRLTLGGSERALLAAGDDQRFVPVDGEIGGFTIVRIDDQRVLVTDGRSRRNIPIERRLGRLGSVSTTPVVNEPIVDPRKAAEERAERMRREIRSGSTTTPTFEQRSIPRDDGADGSDDGSEGS